MPNYCDNRFKVSHSDTTMIDRFVKGFEAGRLLGEFIPMPEELKSLPRDLPSDIAEANILKYGSPDWHSWAGVHWGTKWDVGGDGGSIYRQDDHTVTGYFQSAWCTPRPAIRKFGEFGFVYAVFHSNDETDSCAISDNAGYQSFVVDFDKFERNNIDWKDATPTAAHQFLQSRYDWWYREKYHPAEHERKNHEDFMRYLKTCKRPD